MKARHITVAKVKEVYIKCIHRDTNGLGEITTNRPDKTGNPVYGLMDFDIAAVVNHHHDVNGHFYQIPVGHGKVLITAMVNELTVHRVVQHDKKVHIVITAKDNRAGENSNILKKEMTEDQLRHCLHLRNAGPGQ